MKSKLNNTIDLSKVNKLEDSSTPLESKELNPFPVEAFPQQLQDVIHEIHGNLGYETGYIGLGALACASIMNGNSHRVKVKNGWVCPANLYGVIIGNSSKKKSPALKFALDPVSQKEKELADQFQLAIDHWELEKSQLDKEDQEKYVIENPKPIRERLKVNDVNQEGLCRLLEENPRGLLMVRDEILAWTNSQNQYRKGSDGQFVLSLFDGASEDSDRVEKSRRVENPFFSVVGGIQPAVLPELAKDNRVNDGFLFRLLFVYPMNTKPVYMTEKEPREWVFEQYKQLMYRIYNTSIKNDLFKEIRFSSAAYKAFVEFANRNTKEASTDGRDYISSLYEKLTGYVPRLALILETLYCSTENKEITEISLNTLNKTFLLIEYFRNSAQMVFKTLESETGLTGLELELYNQLSESFTTQEAKEICRVIGFSEATFKNKRVGKNGTWIREKLIEKIVQGTYRKLK